jgi:DEAD/DEAH box helicase domain-containing protein
VKQFYSHQAEAINHILEGKHLVISTSTASGKSVIYNLPILNTILDNNKATALYLFPTKALAQDQLRVLATLICNHRDANHSRKSDKSTDNTHLPVVAVACDGDTGHYDRIDAKEGANIILTNPDMLHCTFLPNHKEWIRLFKNLKYVVIDESHQYRGAFGSHVACVIRRLLRICAHYCSQPQFICCSATIANPADHFSKLIPLSCVGDIYIFMYTCINMYMYIYI